MMEAAITSETSVNVYQTTRRNNPEENHFLLADLFINKSPYKLHVTSREYVQLFSQHCLVSFLNITAVQDDRKFTQPIPDTYSTCQKINHIEIRK
jgi:hypothetical protein